MTGKSVSETIILMIYPFIRDRRNIAADIIFTDGSPYAGEVSPGFSACSLKYFYDVCLVRTPEVCR